MTSFRNASDDWVIFTSEVRAAGEFEHFLRSLFGLAIAGKVNKEGTPTKCPQPPLTSLNSNFIK